MKKLSDTWRLTLSYLAIIMTLSLVFSAVVFAIISSQLDRPLPPRRDGQSIVSSSGWSDWQREQILLRNAETRGSVVLSFILLNTGMLISGTAFSYFLARRTLKPIEESVRTQVQFVSDASHELRTPLTALLTSNEVALRKKVLTEEKSRQVLEKNVAEITKLQELSNSLLGLARMDQELEKPSRVKVLGLVDEVMEQVESSAKAKKITIEKQVGADLTVNLPSATVRQILTILTDNAVKYSPEKSTVFVLAERSGKSLKLSVRDQGPGIDPKDQAKIFERFYRTDSARTRGENSGYGLGLAIAKKLTDRYGWQISVKSEPGQGAEFTFTVHNC